MVRHSAIICDDHPIFRSGVVHCLSEMPEVEIVAEAADVPSAIAKIQLYEPDLVVTDLSMPGDSGFDLLTWVRENQPTTRVVILSMHTELTFVRRAKSLGAIAFLAKEDAETDLVHAINTPDGSFYTSESIGKSVEVSSFEVNEPGLDDLLKYVSPAEMRVLVELSNSKTNREIGESLNLSSRTVEAHRSSLAEKLDAKGPNKLLELAIQHRHLLNRNS